MVFTDSSILFVKFISQLVILSLQGDTSNILGPLIFAAGRGQYIAMCNTLRILVFNSTVSYAYNDRDIRLLIKFLTVYTCITFHFFALTLAD